MSYIMLGIWNYSLKAASERFSPWMCDAVGTAAWPARRLCCALTITLRLSASLRTQLLSAKRADPHDGLCREACDAELQQSKVTVNPGTSVSIFLPFFSSAQSWMKRMLPFSVEVQLPSSCSSRACDTYAACFSLICSFIMMTCLTMAVYPCARGEPAWPKEDSRLLLLGQQCCDP